MTYTAPPAVVTNGGVIDAAADNTFRTNILELQAQLPDVGTSFAPALANATATVTAGRWARIGPTVTGHVLWTVSACSGDMSFNLPVASLIRGIVGQVQFLDTGGTRYFGHLMTLADASASCLIRGINAAATGAATEVITSSTSPFTWGAGDFVVVRFNYLVA